MSEAYGRISRILDARAVNFGIPVKNPSAIPPDFTDQSPSGTLRKGTSLIVLFVGKTFSHEGVHLLEPGVREFLRELSTNIEANDN